jgi:ATP-dependent helicase/DNAse subunit B
VARICRAGKIIQLRTEGEGGASDNFEGDLSGISDLIEAKYLDSEIWSASRLENYQTCPFNFFIGNLLGLEKIEPPEEGLDGRQLGNIYHRILENLYLNVSREYQLNDLLEALPGAAAEVFQKAPFEEGFRETAWWQQTQAEIIRNLRFSLAVIEGLSTEFRFHSAEHRFGMGRSQSSSLVVVVPGEGEFRLRGLIDRVDRSQEGKLRIIDYKTGGPGGFSNKSVQEGRKLQLPLYALAAEQALDLGLVQEGFYFHLQAAQASGFSMSKFRDGGKTGPRAAMEVAALQGWTAVKLIRRGEYPPHSPDTGCPSYCPAADFCWKYQPGYR